MPVAPDGRVTVCPHETDTTVTSAILRWPLGETFQD
jgi:hypothetical protein